MFPLWLGNREPVAAEIDQTIYLGADETWIPWGRHSMPPHLIGTR
jgi:hypothetical protein